MLPAWLTIELALIPVFLAGGGFVVWIARLGAMVKSERQQRIDDTTRQAKHNDRLYGEMRKVNNNLHRLMGKLDVEPVD